MARLTADQKKLTASLQEYAALLKNFNVTQTGARDALMKYDQIVSQTAADSKGLADTQKTLQTIQSENAKRVMELSAAYEGLLNEYHQLDPAASNFKERQKQINGEIKLILPGIRTYNQALKNAKGMTDAAEGSLNKMKQQLSQLRKSLSELPNAFNKSTGAINKQNAEAMKLQGQIQQLDKAVKKAEAGMGQFYRNVGNYTSAIGGYFKNMVAPVTVVTAAISALNRIISRSVDVSQRFQALNIALETISDSTENFAINTQFLNETANKYGQDIFTLIEAYKGLAATTRGTNLEGVGTRKVFESIIQAGTVLKLSNDQVKGSLLAVQQMFSKGTVQAEELRGQLGERLPGAFKLFAESLGKSEKELNKMLEKGEVLANEALPKFAAKLSEVYGPDAAKNANALVNESNRLENSINRILDSNAVVRFWSTMKKGLADYIDNWNYAMNSGKASIWDMWTISGRKKIQEAREKDQAHESAMLDHYTRYEQATMERRAEMLSQAAAKEDALNKKVALMLDERDAIEAKGSKKQKERLDRQIAHFTEKANAARKYVDTLRDINERVNENEKKGAVTSAPTEAEQKKALDAFKDRIKKEQDLLKSSYELDLANAELAAARKEITERDFQEKKFDLGTTYVAAAISKELELGRSADQVRLNDYKKLLVDLQKAKEQFDEKQYQKLRSGTRKSISTVDAAPAKATGKSVVGDAVLPGLDQRVQDAIEAEKMAFDIIQAGRDTQFSEELAHLERMKSIKLKYKRDTAQEEYAIAVLNAERERELQKQMQQLIFDAMSTGLAIVQDQFNARFEERISKLEAEKQKELELAGNNAAAKEIIEANYNRKIAQEKRKQARSDKAFSLFNVAINTASGIMTTVKQWGMPAAIPFIAMVAATGILQAAAIAAKPIPAFKKGKGKDGYKGPGLWGEAGYEIMEKKGKMYLADKPTLTQMEGDEKIYSHQASKKLIEEFTRTEEVNRIINANMLQSKLAKDIREGAVRYRISELGAAMKSGGISESSMRAIMKDAVRSIPVQENHYNERGYIKRTRELNARKTYLDAR